MAMIGIDLGTTTSEIAVYENGKIRLFKDARGNDIIQSYFGIDNKTRHPIVGEQAKNLLKSHPELVVEQVKRRMGSSERIAVGDSEFLPEEISAQILTELIRMAETQLGQTVDSVVITVPANFPDPARAATRRAGEIAGVKVKRIINEPTAAALAFGLQEGLDEELVMVYDLGGGTFDVSIVEYVGDALDVLASAGDPHLGGKDFDRLLLDHVATSFSEEYDVDLAPGSSEYFRLLLACEDAKKELSYNLETVVNVPFLTVKDGQPLSVEIPISRAQLERLIEPLIARTGKSMEAALRAAGKQKEDISRVLLVGGSTRIPAARDLVMREMGIQPSHEVDPDRAVAIGAAAQSAIIDGSSDQIIMDVCPLSLGTSVLESVGETFLPGHYSEIIPPNWKLLKPKACDYRTVVDNQESVDFRVYQRSAESESQWAEIGDVPNREAGFTLLGNKDVSVPPGPAGQRVKVTYVYNQDGIIEVTVEVGGRRESFQISALTDSSAVEASRARVAGMWKESDYYEEVKALIHAAEKELERGMETNRRDRLEYLVAEIKVALAENDHEHVKRAEDEITDLLFDVR